MNQTWLGIDPGLAIIGWAFLEEIQAQDAKLLEFGTIETSKEFATSERLLEIERDMVELIAEFQPSQVAIEMPFFNRTIKAAGGVLQAFGVINLEVFLNGSDIFINELIRLTGQWLSEFGFFSQVS